MRRPMLLAAALTALLLFPAAATAKGPSAATISGPGLAHALTIDGYGEGESTSPLGILVTETGLFAQAFEQTPVATTRAWRNSSTPRRAGWKRLAPLQALAEALCRAGPAVTS